MGRVYGVILQKGGVGKTTSTLYLGYSFAGQGKKVLLVDCDPQGSLTLLLGVARPDQLELTLSDLMEAEAKGLDYNTRDYIQTNGTLDYIPSNIILSGTEMSLMNEMCREQVLKNILSQVKDEYDVILCDAPPSLNLMSVNIMTAADKLLIPTEADYLAIKGLEQLLHSYKNIRKKLNPSLQIAGIFWTQFVKNQKNSKEIEELLQGLLAGGIRIFDTKIPMSVKAKDAAREQENLLKFAPKNSVAVAYKQLASEISSLEQE